MRLLRMKWCLLALSVMLVAGGVSVGQEREGRGEGGRGRGAFGFGGGFGGGGAAGLLQRNDVQEELELLDDQKKQLTELREKQAERMREAFGNLRGGDGNRGEEMRELFTKLRDESQAELDKILLPHQSKRLKQLEMQLRMRGGGVLGGLDRDLGEQLGISESQREQLRDKARDLDAELRKKTAEIRKQLQDQLLASLSEEQRKQFKDLIGEPFEFKDEGPGFGGPGGPGGFGGFGGPGGPGGRRGGDRDRDRNN